MKIKRIKKYNISEEYGIFTKFKPPYNRFVFSISSLVLSIYPKLLKNNDNVKIIKRKISSNDGKNINLYIFSPVKTETNKIFLYIHGGGFTFKGYSSHYKLCERFALEANCKVVYVDYRLSPRYQYPIPFDDCFSAYKWIVENNNKLKIDINKIIVGGDSAGGCLAVDITLNAIKENLVRPCYQMLIYPVLDKRMITNSMKKYTDTPMWNSKLNKKMWKYYLGNKQYISPMEVKSFNNIPSTYIETAEYDCLHDEAIEFAKKLKEAGVDIEVYETKNTMHGYDIKDCSIKEKAILNRIEKIKNL